MLFPCRNILIRNSKFCFHDVVFYSITFYVMHFPVKIWGDRKMFSVRFLGELLSGLEPFRAEKTQEGISNTTAGPSSRTSPAAGVRNVSSPSVGGTSSGTSGRSITAGGSSSASKLRRSLSAGTSSAPTSDGGSDDEDIFGTSHREHSLNIDFISDFTVTKEDKSLVASATASNTRSATAMPASVTNSSNKRKRSIGQDTTTVAIKSSPAANATGGSSSSSRRSLLTKKKASLADILDELETLKSQYLMSQSFVASIPESYFSTDTSGMESMVGDELRDMYRKVFEVERNATRHCIKLHGIARRRRTLEEELVQSIPQLRMQMRQDEEDLRLCEQLESKIQLLLPHHDNAREDRERRREEERVKQEASEAEARKREDEERKKREFEEILKSTQSGAGMVWNPVAKEYQAVNDVTMESWRD
jgi:hypothetical protein